MTDISKIPAGFNDGEDSISRPDLWAHFVAVVEGEVFSHFSFARSVAEGTIAAFRSGPIFVEVASPADIPPTGTLWDGQTFIAAPITEL